MNLNQFEYLLAIYEQGSITKAAQKLFVSAPAISNAIRSLEEELGYAILLRYQNGVGFTSEGEEVIKTVKNIQNLIIHLKQIQCTECKIYGEYVMASNFHFTSILVLPTILDLHKEFSNVRIHLKTGDSYSIISQVEQEEVDFGLVLRCNLDAHMQQREINRYNLKWITLFNDEMRFLVRKGHPLLVKKRLKLTDLFSYPFICYADTNNKHIPEFFEMLLLETEKENDSFESISNMVRVNDRENLFEMLAMTDGVAFVPFSNNLYLKKHYPDLCFVNFSDEQLNAEVGLVYKGKDFDQSLELLLEEFEIRLTKYFKERCFVND
ncbi:MAG: LysR family transcriptional regulator [Peptococcaceae bacterium]|nr:LysR family transcriptional regulator [Peptococcaceae bacterium]